MSPNRIIAPTALPLDLAEARQHVRQDFDFDDAKIIALMRAVTDFAETETQRCLVAARYEQVLSSFPGPSLIGVPYGQPYSLPAHAIQILRSPLIQLVSIQYLDMAGQWQTMPATDYAIANFGKLPIVTPVFGKIWPIALPQIGAVRVTYDAGFCAPLTADVAANTITVRGWRTLAVNDAVRLSNSGGALPAPLQEDTDYFIQSVASPGVYALSAAPGGAVIDITGPGSGTHYLGSVPSCIKGWMLARLGGMYAHRGDSIAVQGKVEALPYIDRMLDAERVLL